MEQYGSEEPAFERQPGYEILARPEEIDKLIGLTDGLLEIGRVSWHSEAVISGEHGSLILRFAAESDDESATSKAVVQVAGPAYPEDTEDILAELAFEGYAYDPLVELDHDDAELARSICVGLIETGRLSPAEVEVALFCTRHLSSLIEDGYHAAQPSKIRLQDKVELPVIEAISALIDRHTKDFVRINSFEWEDEANETELTIAAFQPSNPERWPDIPELQMIFQDFKAGLQFVLSVPREGGPCVVETEWDDEEPEPVPPERYHIRKLTEAVRSALQQNGVFDMNDVRRRLGFSPDGRPPYDTALACEAVEAFCQYKEAQVATPDKAAARQRYAAAMRCLSEDFEARYHLIPKSRHGQEKTINLRGHKIFDPQGFFLSKNVLLLNAPEFFMHCEGGVTPVELENENVLVEYDELRIGRLRTEDMADDASITEGVELFISGRRAHGGDGRACLVPMSQCEVVMYNRINN